MSQNRLASETSPYLLQHAHNPVDWHPWGPDALDRAKRENKPILLSIGYSACHWCHVMAHESFEDEETAAVMNELFVNIKVDREERPDIDKIYQLAHSAITQRSGGWPLTMFLTPDQVPFFGGTYFPREPRYQMPAFKDVLRRVARYLHEHPDEVQRQNASLTELFRSLETRASPDDYPADGRWLETAAGALQEHFDAEHGGFGGAPKFPHPTNLELALRFWASGGNSRLLHIARFSLEQMARSGVYDQLGGGFYRYSVDDRWMIPHFEKMLYDNGQLLTVLAQAWQATRAGAFKKAATETVDWLLREMRAPEGAFYATLDADSEGEEGRFYAWTPAEVKTLLNEQEFEVFSQVFGLNKPANFENHWHLHAFNDPGRVAGELDLEIDQVHALLESARVKLLAARNQRVPPGRDEKVLTSWNGLMIKGLALAGNVFNRDDWIITAEQALDFIRQTLWDGELLYACYKDKQVKFPAYLDDYAFLLDATLELLQARWQKQDLDFARELAGVLLRRFEDKARGGFYFTPEGHEALIYRPKQHGDEATPAGGAVAAFALQRLGHLLGHTEYLDAAERALKDAVHELQQSPLAHAGFLKVLDEYLEPPAIIVLRGSTGALTPWRNYVKDTFRPRVAVYTIAIDVQDLPAQLAERKPRGDAVAYICQKMSCSAPITEFEAFKTAVNNL
ncbi:MAG TPA: thioredoxin domain-containing protein [Gammaproteobacteria bacterium]